jgi:hypothetical protein
MAPCDPCEIHAESFETETVWFHKILGANVSVCHDEFEGEVYEDGEGHVGLTEATGPGCIVTPCDGGEAEWPIHIEESNPGEVANLRFCVSVGGGADTHCDIAYDVADEGTHMWVIRASGAECQNGVPIAITGAWELEYEDRGHVNIEIAHERD